MQYDRLSQTERAQEVRHQRPAVSFHFHEVQEQAQLIHNYGHELRGCFWNRGNGTQGNFWVLGKVSGYVSIYIYKKLIGPYPYGLCPL